MDYKGYSIDISNDKSETFIIYDNVLGDYLNHDSFYNLDEVFTYIDNLKE